MTKLISDNQEVEHVPLTVESIRPVATLLYMGHLNPFKNC